MLSTHEMFEALRLRQREPEEAKSTGHAVASWRAPELDDFDQYQRYLTANGWTTDELEGRLTSETPAPGALSWVNTFARINNTPQHNGAYSGPYKYNAQELIDLPFKDFFIPFLDHADERIHSTFRTELKTVTVSPTAIDSIRRGLASSLLELSLQVLIQSFREAGVSYSEYHRRLGTVKGRESLFSSYPVLARRLDETIHNFVSNVQTMLLALDTDSPILRSNGLLTNNRLEITDVAIGLGDPHEQGKSISIVTVNDEKIVYRPRSSPEYSLYEALVKAASLETILPTLNSLDRYTHTWVEYASQASKDEIPLESHFYKMGVLAGFAYGLGSTDLHMENVIATTAGPVPVDAETILGAGVDDDGGEGAFNLARKFLNDSAIGTGILPVGVQISGSDDFEVSALCGGTRTITGTYDAVVDPYGDSIAIGKFEGQTGISSNTPSGTSSEDVAVHSTDVMAGVTAAFDHLSEFSDAIQNTLDQYKSIDFRVILRPTSLYDLTRRALLHPRHMKSMLAAEKFLLRFWKPVMSDAIRGPKAHLAEIDQLLSGDIPRFTVVADSNEVRSGAASVAQLRESPVDRCKRRIKSLQATPSRHIQEGLVSEVLNSLTLGVTEHVPEEPTVDPHANIEAETPTDLLMSLIETLTQRFAAESFLGDGQATWLGMISSEDGSAVRLAPSGTGLFDGLAGIGLGLASVHAATGDETTSSLARQALSPVVEDLRRWSRDPDGPVGAFGGASGLAYSLLVGQDLIGDPSGDYRQAISEYVRTVKDAVRDDRFFDLGSGAAGAASVLSCLMETGLPSRSEGLEALEAATTRLKDSAQSFNGLAGKGWIANHLKLPLGGFSHGVSGIGWALARATPWLNDDRLPGLAADALLFDTNYWVDSRGLWRDMRPENGSQAVFPVHWCHGASGIYLSRALSHSYLPDLITVATVEQAKAALLDSPMPGNDSLCHGTLGNSVCLYAAGDRHDGDVYFTSAMRGILNSTFRHGLGFNARSVPGLMLGYSGFLHALSIALDGTVPPVLSLSSTGLSFR